MLERLHSALGIFAILAIAWLIGPRESRAAVKPRTVGGALLLLFGFAIVVLKTPATRLFAAANNGVDALLRFTGEGARFLFGSVADANGQFGYVFAVQVLPTILFFSALMSLLYHVRLMPWLVERCGRLLVRLLGVSGAESLSTVADIFVGQAEAPLVIRPYVASMTRSEINACMVAGYATTAGGVLAAYVSMLSSSVPGIAGHLIAASVMGAPASLVIAKLILPETEQPKTAGGVAEPVPVTTSNWIDAITRGTIDGLGLALNIGAMLIVFIALTALLNSGFATVSGWFGTSFTLDDVLRIVFYPLAWLLGVPMSEVSKVAGLLGTKTLLNEFVAYSQLTTQLNADPSWLSERSRLIASYALCGFANFGSIGIQVAAYSTLAPERTGDISRLALRAMFGGLLATCLIACVAGVLL